MDTESTIKQLNESVFCKLAPSSIHGIGVFAIRPVPQGQKLYCTESIQDPLSVTSFTGCHPAIVELIKQRWPLALETQHFISPNQDARLVSFMNHSATPNYDKYTDCALRDIEVGEEITENYAPEITPPVDN